MYLVRYAFFTMEYLKNNAREHLYFDASDCLMLINSSKCSIDI